MPPAKTIPPPALLRRSEAVPITIDTTATPSTVTVHIDIAKSNCELDQEDIFGAFEAIGIKMTTPESIDSEYPFEWLSTYTVCLLDDTPLECLFGTTIFATTDGHIVELRRLDGSRFAFSDAIEKINARLGTEIPGGGLVKRFTPPPY